MAVASIPTYVKSVPVSKIDGPVHNARHEFPPEEIEQLAESIESVGLLEPIIARPKGKRFELVAGERRLRAVKHLGRKEILANVRKLSDSEAAEIGLLENLDRENLTAIEEAAAFGQLIDLGYSIQAISELTRRPLEAVDSRHRLLELPEEWQERVHRGELTPVAAEYLLDWLDFPEVLDAMEEALVNWPMPLVQWRRTLAETVVSLSRSMAPSDPEGPRFDVNALSEDQRDALRIVTVRPNPRTELVRAMGTEFWDVLQRQAAERHAEQEAETGYHAEAHLDVEDPQPASTGRRRRRAETAAEDEDDLQSPLQERVDAWRDRWLRGLILERINGLDYGGLLDVAVGIGLDLPGEWRLTREFLEIHTGAELRDLAEDLGVDVSQCQDAEEIRAVLLHLDPPEVPQTVLGEAEAGRFAG